MRNQVTHFLAVILLALRRTFTRKAAAEASNHDYGQASSLGCIGIRTLIQSWINDPSNWCEDMYWNFLLDVPGVGQFKLYDPTSDEQLSSGYLVLSLNNKRLLKQRSDEGSLGWLCKAICYQIRSGFSKLLDSWLTDDSSWEEIGSDQWPYRTTTREFRLKGPLLPQDAERSFYRIGIYPLDGRISLTRDGCSYFTKDPRVVKLYENLCRRPPLVAVA